MNAPMAGQPLLSILRCARPILFYNQSYDYPYSTSGTAFILRFLGRLFIVTAKHALRLCDFEANQFRVQYHLTRPEMLPVQALYLPGGPQLQDADQNDLAVWDVDTAQIVEDLFGEYAPYDLDRQEWFEQINPESDFLYSGYPIQVRNIDFQRRHYNQDSISGAATYIGPSQSMARVHEVHFRNLGDLTDIDGLSGSPVFETRPLHGQVSRASLAGMLLRGSAASSTGYFLESSRVVEMLVEIAMGRVNERYDLPR